MLLTAPEVAEMLRLSPKSVYAMARESRLPHIRMGDGRRPTVRFRREDIDTYLRQHAVASVTSESTPARGGSDRVEEYVPRSKRCPA